MKAVQAIQAGKKKKNPLKNVSRELIKKVMSDYTEDVGDNTSELFTPRY